MNVPLRSRYAGRGDGSRQPEEWELQTARNLGQRVAEVAARLKDLRRKG